MGNALAWPHRTVETVTDPSHFESDLCIRGEYRFGYRGLRVSSSNVANTFAVVLLLSATARERSRTPTPQRFAFFGWIIGIGTVLAGAEPFTANARLSEKSATPRSTSLSGWLSGLSCPEARTARYRQPRQQTFTSRTPSSGAAPRPPLDAEPPKAGTWLAARCAERAARAAPLRRR